MSIAVDLRVAEQQPAVQAVAPVRRPQPWLLGPWLDLMFLANLTWPLIVLAALAGNAVSSWEASSVVQSLTFWQIYFLSTPHRWITLVLVYCDEDRFQQRPRAFVGVALFFILLVTMAVMTLGITVGTAFLAAIDFFWNAWHFAAQHSGISRIYARAARPQEQSRGLLEKILLRAFVLYVIVRVGAAACAPHCGGVDLPLSQRLGALVFSGSSTFLGHVEAFNIQAEAWLDGLFLLCPVLLLGIEIVRFQASAIGRMAYLISVFAAYGLLLYAAHAHQVVLMLAVALSIALFHATEYLAIVSWSVLRRPAQTGTLARLAKRWLLSLSLFVVVLGVSAWAIAHQLAREWAILTIAVSFLHYAYDGMIWKAPRRKPS